MERTGASEGSGFNAEQLIDLSLLKVRDLGRVVDDFLEAALADKGLSVTEFRALSACAANPACTAVDLSRIIPVDPPAISRLVHSLVQRGLMSRRRSVRDRREVRLRVTADGLAALGECQPLLEKDSAEFLRPLSEAQARAFIRAVETLLAAGF